MLNDWVGSSTLIADPDGDWPFSSVKPEIESDPLCTSKMRDELFPEIVSKFGPGP